MATKTKKEWITQLIGIARDCGNKNPWGLGWAAYDELRMIYQGPQKESGEEWYATHQNDIYGLKDTLSIPDDVDLKKFVKVFFAKLQAQGGQHFWIIPSSQLSDLIKYLVAHPRFRGNLLDMAGESPWTEPTIDFENMCVEATTQFLNDEPIKVVFQYKDADTGLVVHTITLSEKDFWYFVDEQQMRIADRRW